MSILNSPNHRNAPRLCRLIARPMQTLVLTCTPFALARVAGRRRAKHSSATLLRGQKLLPRSASMPLLAQARRFLEIGQTDRHMGLRLKTFPAAGLIAGIGRVEGVDNA